MLPRKVNTPKGQTPLVRDVGGDGGTTTYVLDPDDVSHYSAATKSSKIVLYENPDYLDVPTTFPYFTVIVTFGQIALYVVWVYTSGETGFQDKAFNEIGGPEFMWLDGISPFSSCTNQHYELWRYLTYVYVHASIYHLIANSLMQFLLGSSLESVHGWFRVGALYTLGGIAGGLNCNMFTPHSTVVGASGAIYALMGMVAANLWINFEDMPLRWWRLLLVIAFVANDALMYIYAYDPFTSYTCHAGGAVFGFFGGVLFLRNLNVTRIERFVAVLCGAALLGCIAAWWTWWGLHDIPEAAIRGDRRVTCCTNILQYGLPIQDSVNSDYLCINYVGDSAALYDNGTGDVYQAINGGWVVV